MSESLISEPWMSDLLAARSIMAFSLGFHIVFAAIGMTMPFLMAASHWHYLRNGSPLDLELTRMWSKGVAILFATGAVSGTVLSFELGLLWPGFMEHAGPIIGMPFSWEGTAFFLEAIALGLFLYGWKRLKPWTHWLSGVAVGICGFMSGVFVLSANAWMNSPTGFTWTSQGAIDVDPVAAMFNKAWFQQTLHMQIAAFEAVGFGVAGIHAWLVLKGRAVHLNLKALKIALVCGAVAACVQPLSGHLSAHWVAQNQPAKLAAMEAHFKTESGAPLIIGGWPDEQKERVDWAVRIPKALSFLAHNDFNAEVQGLDAIPKDERPPVLVTHLAFQTMVGLGLLLLFTGLFGLWKVWRKQSFPKWFLRWLVCCAPLGFIAIEAGWIVTEVGRQPWIIYGIMKTSEAVTPKPGLQYHFALFLGLYLLIGAACTWLLTRLIRVHAYNDAPSSSVPLTDQIPARETK